MAESGTLTRKTGQKFLQIPVSLRLIKYIFTHPFVLGKNSQVVVEESRHVPFAQLAAALEVSHEFEEVQVVGEIWILSIHHLLHLWSIRRAFIQNIANSLQIGCFIDLRIQVR